MLDAYASELNSIFNGIYDSIQRLEEQLLSQSGQQLSISELHIIETVWRYRSSGCSISDIAQEHQVTLPSMTIAIKSSKKGYVAKRRSDTDGRVVYVKLTRMGEKVNSMHRYFHEHMIRAFIKGVDEEQKPVLLSALKKHGEFYQASA